MVESGDMSSITGSLPANISIFSVIKSTNHTSLSANKFLTCSMVTLEDVALIGAVTLTDASVVGVEDERVGRTNFSIWMTPRRVFP